MALTDIVVVGAGEAGARATVALREQGYDGALRNMTVIASKAKQSTVKLPLPR